MNEQKHSPTEALITIVFLLVLLTFFVYKFGKNQNAIVNPQALSTSQKVTDEERAKIREKTGDIFSGYINKILESKEKGEVLDTEKLSNDFKKDIETELAIPEENIYIKLVSQSASKADYLNTIDKMFLNLQKQTGGEENKIFQSQITPEGNLMPLSEYDKDTLRRIKQDYENFANSLVELETPKIYEEKAMLLAKDAKKIAYILNQIIENKNDKIYHLWISKYVDSVFDIIALRYDFR